MGKLDTTRPRRSTSPSHYNETGNSTNHAAIIMKHAEGEKTLHTSAPVAKMVESIIHLFNLPEVEGSELVLVHVEYSRYG